jgi:inosine/xanthosine triphosphate pyrophosphatase family protein
MEVQMLKNVESENLKKLREVVTLLEAHDFDFEDNDYQKLTCEIDDLIHVEMDKINQANNKSCKLKAYEALFTSIITLIEGSKHLI